MPFKIPVIISLLAIFLPRYDCQDIVYAFPGLENWTNALDTSEKLTAFLASDHAFGRERVIMHQDEGQEMEACLGDSHNKLVHALQRIKSSRKSQQVVLVFERHEQFALAYPVLMLMQHKWIWLHFPIVQGPYDLLEPVRLEQFTDKELELMRSFHISFGFTFENNFGKGEYLKEHMAQLAKNSDRWFQRLDVQTNFMMELGMHVLLNTSDMVRVMEPLFNREVLICYATTSVHSQFVISHAGYMESIAKITGKKRLYINVPPEVFAKLRPRKWFPVEVESLAHPLSAKGAFIAYVLIIYRLLLLLIP